MDVRGKFITVEGGEGVGKTALVMGLAQSLKQAGLEVVVTREPGGTTVADSIRKLFASPPKHEPLTMVTEALLVSAARAQHVAHKIRPALGRGEWVISDRFADSTRIYQGALGGLNTADLEALIEFSTNGLEPDLTLLLDVDTDIALSRLSSRSNDNSNDAITRYDQAAATFHNRLRRAFLSLAESQPERVVTLDGALNLESVLADARRQVEKRFGRL